MKLAAIIVTYYPDIDVLSRNIASFSDLVDTLMLWDNSDLPIDPSAIKRSFPNMIIHQEGCNKGLPAAYNWAAQVAAQNGCTHLMTMDQDSIFENFKEYRLRLESFADPAVGIFTCPVNNDISAAGYREATVCQSGSVYTINMLQHIGGFREDLFIGMVDAEMSLRALERNYKIYQMTECNLTQHVGANREVSFLGHSATVSDYSPLRHYYDSRNRILMWHEFPYDFALKHKVRHFWSRVKLMTKIVLFEHDKTAKIKAILTGTWFGLRNRTRPYIPTT